MAKIDGGSRRPIRVDGGATEIEQRATNARLKKLGIDVDADSIVRTNGKVSGGMEAIARAAGADDVLDLYEIPQVSLSVGTRIVGALQDRTAQRVAAKTVASTRKACDDAAAELKSFGTTPDAGAESLADCLEKATKGLASVLEAPVLEHLVEPRALAELVSSHGALFDLVRRWRDAAELSTKGSAIETRLTAALQQFFEHGRAFLNEDERALPTTLLSANVRAALFASESEREGALALLRNSAFAALDPSQRDTLAQLATIDAKAACGAAEACAKLPAEHRNDVLLLMTRAQYSYDRKAVLRLVGRPGFGECVAELDLLAAVTRDPNSAVYALADFLDRPALRALAIEERSLVVRSLIAWRAQRDALKTLRDLVELPGFLELSATHRALALRYFGGANQQLSEPARLDLAPRLAELGEQPAQQAQSLRELLTSQPSAPHRPIVPDGRYAPAQTQVSVDAVRRARDVDVKDAALYTVSFDGRSIPVYVPRDPPPFYGYTYTLEDVTSAIARLPEWSRRALTTLTLVPGRNPHDDFLAKKFGISDFWTAMDCAYEGGHIRVFGTTRRNPLDDLVSDLVHETAHALSFRHWGTDSNKEAWDRWNEAMTSDQIRPSGYGAKSSLEDFAEAMALFWAVKDTPAEAEIRALMPARIALLEELLAADAQRAAEAAARLTSAPSWATLPENERNVFTRLQALRPTEALCVPFVEGKLTALPESTRRVLMSAIEALEVRRPSGIVLLQKLVNYPGFSAIHPDNQADLIRVLTGSRVGTQSFMAQRIIATLDARANEVSGRDALKNLLDNLDWEVLSAQLVMPDNVEVPELERRTTYDARRQALTRLTGDAGLNITVEFLEPIDNENVRRGLEDAVATLPTELRPLVRNATIHYFYGGSTKGVSEWPDRLYLEWGWGSAHLGGMHFLTEVHRSAWELYERTQLSWQEREQWNEATKADRMRPSQREAREGDFAITAQLYRRVQGTPDEAVLRVALPHRFALLDKYLARPLKTSS